MTQTLTIRAIAGASAIAAISAITMFASAGSASAKSIAYCDGTSRGAVVDCCQEQVDRKGLPAWMKHSGSNCNKVVKCRYGTFAGANRYCWVSVLQIHESHSKDRRRK